ALGGLASEGILTALDTAATSAYPELTSMAGGRARRIIRGRLPSSRIVRWPILLGAVFVLLALLLAAEHTTPSGSLNAQLARHGTLVSKGFTTQSSGSVQESDGDFATQSSGGVRESDSGFTTQNNESDFESNEPPD